MVRNARLARFRAAIAGLVLSLAFLPGVTVLADESASEVEITTVNGQPVDGGQVEEPLSGEVRVEGTTGGLQAVPEPQSLVADAGDSAFVAAGEEAVLLGAAYGGTEPYTFAWSTQHGKLSHPMSSSTELDTAGLEPGTYDAQLTVTDSAGASTSDTVKFVVKGVEEKTLHDKAVPAQPPGVIAVGWTATIDFTVPAHTDRIDATLSYGDANNDYKLNLVDPDGASAGESQTDAGTTEEAVAVDGPKAGTWQAEVTKWTPFADTAHLTITALVGQPDPRPKVSAGGPYAFATGTEQTLNGSVTAATGGVSDPGPFDAAWDLDGDGVFETDGADATAALPEIGRAHV